MNIGGGLQAVFIILILGVLETSLSFENAVVNANVLKKMSHKRQQRFLTRGMAIAVFGMRVIFPLIIVAIVGQVNPIQALKLAIFDPNMYAQILTSSHIVIAGFGGTFLLLVALDFFLDMGKQIHWIKPIERFLTKMGELKSVEIIVALLAVMIVAKLLPSQDVISFLMSGTR